MKIDKKQYKTISTHVSLEIAKNLEKIAEKDKRSLSYTIGEILEAYVKPKANKQQRGK